MKRFWIIVLSLYMAQFGAFAAPAQRRGTNNANATTQQTGGSPVAARAGARQKVVNNTATATKQTPAATVTGNTSARAGKKQAVVNNPNAGKVQGARAASTQKVINTGQKVSTAASNTTVSTECQDAFFGCMDSFCMLDNVSGGRCQCSDKITELNNILEDILKTDKETYVMATAGVERIQMGEAAEHVDSAVNSVAKKDNKDMLSAWNTTTQDDDKDDDKDSSNTFTNKKGDALYKASARMCLSTIPEQCKQNGQMLQLVYAQRIKSDCVAYENSLKQQKTESKQKLQTAQKALRDAATEEFNEQNKYGTAGECAIEFAKCMQTTAECGADYTGCVTLAAKENVRNNSSGTVAKQTKVKGKVAGSNITLAASTMETLMAKKEICAYVTKQCVNSNKDDAVWNVFLRNAAPALKSAEEMAEQNLRMQCIPTLADCFKTACKSQIDPKDEEGSFDMCLSNPKTYKSLCKVQLEPCLEATGGTYDKPEQSSLWNSLLAALNSMKVDACTKQVRTCLTERCGDDFAGCVGLDTETIGNLCPVDKLTACMTDYDRNTVRDYVAEIAQGLAVQIDNSLLAVCQKAVNDSMMRVCGDTETCDALTKDENLGTRSLKYEVCSFKADEENKSIIVGDCRQSLDQISNSEWDEWAWLGAVDGLLYWGHIDYDFDTHQFTSADKYVNDVDTQFGGIKDEEKELTKNVYDTEIAFLQSSINNAIDAIESDPTVQYCMTGREVQGFDGTKIGKSTKRVKNEETGKFELLDASASRFPNLTDQMKRIIISYTLRGARDNYDKKYSEVYEQLMKDQVAAAEKNDHAKAVETAKNTCDAWAASSVLPRTKTPTNVWTWVGMAILAAACVVAAVFTGGASFNLLATALVNVISNVSATVVVTATFATTVATSVAAGVAAAGVAVKGGIEESARNKSDTTAGPGYAELDQWNYKAKIKTFFNETTGECTKETVSSNCEKESWSTGKCKIWAPEQTQTQKIKLY